MTTDLYSDELCQLARQGMGQAAGMLSRLLRQQVRIDFSGRSQFVYEVVAETEGTPQIGVYMPVSGELTGGMLLTMSEECAGWMGQQLLNMGSCDLLVEPVSSTLKEVGNIIASAFLASIDSQLGVRALPEPPQLKKALASELQSDCRPADNQDCLLVRTDLIIGDEGVLRGAIYLFPSADSLDLLRSRIAAVSLSKKSC